MPKLIESRLARSHLILPWHSVRFLPIFMPPVIAPNGSSQLLWYGIVDGSCRSSSTAPRIWTGAPPVIWVIPAAVRPFFTELGLYCLRDVIRDCSSPIVLILVVLVANLFCNRHVRQVIVHFLLQFVFRLRTICNLFVANVHILAS